MAQTNKEKWAAQAPPKPANWSNNFRVPPMPKIREAVSGNQLLAGLAAHDTANEQWRQDLEKNIAERIDQTKPTATTTTVAAPAVAAPASVTGVASVNGRTGAVSLTSDDVPQGVTNKYMTAAAWAAFFDLLGYGRNLIATGETITVPANRNLVITGPLLIQGVFQVDGHFAAL